MASSPDTGSWTPSRAIPYANLKEFAASWIRERIFSGELRPGSKIDQDAIAQELGISKLPVREALITLDSEGLVNIVARRGAFVASLTREDILDHYQLFGMVAGIAAERAATNLTEADLDRLENVLDKLEASDSPEMRAQLNDEFHRIINLAGRSRRLMSVLKLLGKALPSRFYEFHTDWSTAADRDHREILAALKQRSPEAARQAVADHLRRSGEHAVRFLESTGFWSSVPDRGRRA
jgi:Transcriptional regulators